MIKYTLAILLITSFSIFEKEPPGEFIGPNTVDVKDFCLTPNSGHVYIATNNIVTLYEIFTGQQINSIQYEDTVEIRSLALTSDSTYLIAGTNKGTIIIHDLIENSAISITISDQPVTSLAINNFNSRIATGTSGGEIILTDIPGGLRETTNPHEGIVTDLEFSSDGEILLSSGMDGAVVITNLLEDNSYYTLIRKKSPCRDVSINGNFTQILASFDNGKVSMVDLKADRSVVRQREFSQGGWQTGVAYHKDNITWARCSSSGKIIIHTIFGMTYSTKIKGVATQIEFYYRQDNRLFVLVSVYNQGLMLVSAMKMKT